MLPRPFATIDTRTAETTPSVTKPVDTRPKKVTTTNVATRPVDTKPVRPVETKTVQTRPVETKPRIVDTAALVSQYKSVGTELKALEQTKGADAASDLQSRYRMIRISDAMSSQPKRDEAATTLSKLHVAIAARQK